MYMYAYMYIKVGSPHFPWTRFNYYDDGWIITYQMKDYLMGAHL